MAGDGGQSPTVEETVGRRWRRQQWCHCSSVVGSSGEMGSHHGDEGEREKERKREEEKRKRSKRVAGARWSSSPASWGPRQ